MLFFANNVLLDMGDTIPSAEFLKEVDDMYLTYFGVCHSGTYAGY